MNATPSPASKRTRSLPRQTRGGLVNTRDFRPARRGSTPTNPRRPRQYTRLQTRTTRQHPNKPEETSSIMGAVHRQSRMSAPWRSDVNLHPTPPRHPSHHPIHARNPSAGGVGQSGSKPRPTGVPGIRSPRKYVPLPSQCSPTIVQDSPSPQYRTPAAGLRLQATFCAATNQTARRPPRT